MNRFDDGRETDLRELYMALAKTRSRDEYRSISQSIAKIKAESHKVKDMRQHLVKAMRNGNAEEVRDINEWVAKHEEYK